MNSRTQERVERWDSRPIDGGYDALSDLEASGFSGAVTAAGSWLFLLNGRVVGVLDGAIEDFRGASGTAYDAPHPALPLLSVMEERAAEPRAKYYTNETPLREVDETLREGSFTGYVELSENVLSGDYYAVYYGGRRMAAAYIGNAERLLSGDEAFERAADEVGIYEVFDVDLEVTDVPTAPGSEDAAGAEDADDAVPSSDPSGVAGAEGIGGSSADAGDDALEDEPPAGDPGSDRERAEPTADAASPEDGAGAAETDAEASVTESAAATDHRSASDVEAATEMSQGEESTGGGADAALAGDDASSDPDLAEIEAAAEELDRRDIDWTDEDESADGATDSATDASARATETDDEERPTDDEPEERFQQEEQWRETRSIPSIDPDNSVTSESSRSTREREATGADEGPASRPSPDPTPSSEAPAESNARAADPEASDAPDQPADPSGTEEEAAAELEALEEERERLDAKNRELSGTVERLQSRIEDLESELAEARTASGLGGSPDDAGAQLSTRDALERTNLFVRYDSKSQPTLESAHDGDADREALASNLRLEHHTEFDAAEAVVDGEPYEEALRETMEYRFVAWLTEVLIHEIRDTGHADALGDLYDAIPRIDRAELNATISLEDDDTEDVPDRVSFDVVAYDKMGNPQVVATLNDSRVPASRELLEDVEADASAVKANYPELAASIVVTSSYFEPGALEVTEEATSGGFLSRGSKLSYVNLSRKQGYHLCLVESRAEGFYMTVPEL